MAKGKGTSGGRGPTPGPSANQSLGDSSIAEASAPESSRDTDVIVEEPREVGAAEIEAAKKLLENTKRQRELAEIMANLAKEEEQLTATLARSGLQLPEHFRKPSAPPSTQDSETAAGDRAQEPRGQKRPRAETATPLPIRPPPKPAMDGLYEGKSMREFNAFMLRMENHFLRYAIWFTNDENKIIDGVQNLSDSLLLKWSQHVKESGDEAQTWKAFRDFFLRQINDPKNLTRRTQQKFTEARQKPYQSIRDFATYLAQP